MALLAIQVAATTTPALAYTAVREVTVQVATTANITVGGDATTITFPITSSTPKDIRLKGGDALWVKAAVTATVDVLVPGV